jgi:hypothetical protein
MLQLMPRNPDVILACERLAEHALRVEPGTLLSFADLYALTALEARALYAVVRRVNRDLLKANRLLVSRRREGYVVATPEQQMGHAQGRRRRGNRQYRWGHEELQAVEVAKLSAEQHQRYYVQLAQLATMVAMSRKRTLQGLAASTKAVQHSQAALQHIDAISVQLKTLRQQFRR